MKPKRNKNIFLLKKVKYKLCPATRHIEIGIPMLKLFQLWRVAGQQICLLYSQLFLAGPCQI